MTPKEFAAFLESPESDQFSVEQIENMLQQYPYVQSLRIAFLKKLRLSNHPDFEKHLHKTATYAYDRVFLKRYINKEPIYVIEYPAMKVEAEQLETLELMPLDKLQGEKVEQSIFDNIPDTPEQKEQLTFPSDDWEEAVEDELGIGAENILETVENIEDQTESITENKSENIEEIIDNEITEDVENVAETTNEITKNESENVEEIVENEVTEHIENVEETTNEITENESENVEEIVENDITEHIENVEETTNEIAENEIENVEDIIDNEITEGVENVEETATEIAENEIENIEDIIDNEITEDVENVEETATEIAENEIENVEDVIDNEITEDVENIEETATEIAKNEIENVEDVTDNDITEHIENVEETTNESTENEIENVEDVIDNEITEVIENVEEATETTSSSELQNIILESKKMEVHAPIEEDIDNLLHEDYLETLDDEIEFGFEIDKTIINDHDDFSLFNHGEHHDKEHHKEQHKEQDEQHHESENDKSTTDEMEKPLHQQIHEQINPKEEDVIEETTDDTEEENTTLSPDNIFSKDELIEEGGLYFLDVIEKEKETIEESPEEEADTSNSKPIEHLKTTLIETEKDPEELPLEEEEDLVPSTENVDKIRATLSNKAVDKQTQKQQVKAALKRISKIPLSEIGVVTETYGDLLAKQGKIEHAIRLYQQLILKNPQKKVYFAAKIKQLIKKM